MYLTVSRTEKIFKGCEIMAAFIQNFLGFMIQLFPCVLMIFLPFPEEAYRFQRRKIYSFMTVISVIMAALFSAVLCLRDMEKYPSHFKISNSMMFLSVLLVLAAYIWLVREALIQKLLVFFLVLFYAETVYILVNSIYACFLAPNQTESTTYPYTARFLMLYAAVTLFLLPLILAVVMRPLRKYIQLTEMKDMRREFFIFTFSMLFYFIVTVYIVTITEAVLYYSFPTLIFLTMDQILIYWLIFRESVRRKLDSDRRRAMEIQQFQYEKIVADMENTRRMRHDMRHHYNSLNDMLERGKLDEMKDYLADLSGAAVKIENEIYCKNMTVNGLLQYYTAMARDADIRCEIHADCSELAIEPADLTVLFGNTMENAINSCAAYNGERWIKARIGTVQDSFAIEISNSCNRTHIDRRFQQTDNFLPAEAFLSDHEGGGYGLRSIAHTAQKYGGSAKFRFDPEKETFIARIRLNMHTEQ